MKLRLLLEKVAEKIAAGTRYEPPCGNCDACQANLPATTTAAAASPVAHPFPLNSRVAHAKWGEGLVMRYEGDKLTILFDAVGYKTLNVAVVQENQLLKPG